MKHLSKLMALVIVIAMLGTLMLAGCASQSTTAAPAATTAAAAGETTVASNEPVTIRFTSWQSMYADQDKLVAAEYQKTHPNVTVEFEYYGDMNSMEYLKKIDLMIMGGEAIDIVMAPSPGDYSRRAQSGSYLALNDLLAAEGKALTDLYVIDTQVDGKYFAIPADLKSFFVMINKDMLDKAGLPVPSLDWTWDDYREYAKKMTSGEGAQKIYGSYYHTWPTMSILPMYSSKVDNAMLKSLTETTFSDPLFAKALQFRYDLEQVDKSSTPLADAKSLQMTYRAKFFNSEVAMIPIGSWMIPEVKDVSKYPHTFQTVFAPLPIWPGDTANLGMTNTANHYYSLASTSKNQQAAYDFLRYYTTEGMKIRGVSMTAEKGVDKMVYVDLMVGADKSLYDYDSLKAVMTNPNWKDNVEAMSPGYVSELGVMVGEEADKFLMGQQDLNTTIAAMTKRGDEIIAAAAK